MCVCLFYILIRTVSHSIKTRSTLNSLGLSFFNQHTHSFIEMQHISITAFCVSSVSHAGFTQSFVFTHFEVTWPLLSYIVIDSHPKPAAVYFWLICQYDFLPKPSGLLNPTALRDA